MFCKSTKPLFVSTSLFLLIAGCDRPRHTGVERVAVMPIENLSSDPQFDWRSRAAAAVVAYDLAGAKNVFARQVESLSAAQSMHASRLAEGYFVERNGRISIHARLENLDNSRTAENFDIEGAASAGFLPLANELARRISPESRSFDTHNDNAFRFYGQALAARDSKSAEQALESARDADPAFITAYLDEAKLLAETGERAKAQTVVELGERVNPDTLDRANLEYARAVAGGDTTDRLKAIEALSKASPANATLAIELAQMQFARRQFQQAAMEYRAAAELDPDDPKTWNELGYALARTGDLRGARESIGQYQRLAPGDANALDSEGEVSFYLGDFKSADEAFERAAAKNPAEWVKAAEAQLMLGDLNKADALFAKRWAGAARNGRAEFPMAQWEVLTGRRQAGMNRLEKLIPALKGDQRALVLDQLAIWKVAGQDKSGDGKAAGELVTEAVGQAESPQVQAFSAMCQFVVSGGKSGAGPKFANAVALLVAKKFSDAVPLLQSIYAETSPAADGQVRTLLAWAYVETGATDKAASLIDPYVLPIESGDQMFASLIFPHSLYVRGKVFERQGKRDEVGRMLALYSKYGGGD